MRSPRQLLVELHASLDARRRPEDIADLALRLLDGTLSKRERVVLSRAASWSARARGRFSSMGHDFARPVGAAAQLAAVARAFELPAPPAVDADDPAAVRAAAARLGRSIRWAPERADFLHDRLDRAGRHAAGIELSRRQYNRRFRALRHLTAKAERLEVERRKRRLILLGRSAFAAELPLDRFAADPDAACFVAYYAAKRNVRRAFTLSGKDSPFDEVAAMLLNRCERAPGTDWDMIAQVMPAWMVLNRLDDRRKGELLGKWSASMRLAAGLLERVWRASGGFDRTRMVVGRGDDSSTWNTMAQAYNAARAGWLACLHALDAAELLEVACPGKAMRLMAADLAAWHSITGGNLHPDTKIWATLPPPWDVVSGTTACTRADVEHACQAAGVDPVEAGWTAPRPANRVAAFTPTPELVHGVAVANPVWALLLRRAGAFSGKRLKAELLPAVEAASERGVIVGELPGASLGGPPPQSGGGAEDG